VPNEENSGDYDMSSDFKERSFFKIFVIILLLIFIVSCHGGSSSQPDSDSDSIIDITDNCPQTENPLQEDLDGDGYGDACDNCPADQNKTEPGICGCGIADINSDTDGDGFTSPGSCLGSADDCNDNDDSIYPGATEVQGDGIDQDCDGQDVISSLTDMVHDNRIITNICSQCHPIGTNADVDILHQSLCSLCHGYSGTKLDVATVEKAIRDGMNGIQIACITCHGEFLISHNNLDHTAIVTVGTTICGNCHKNQPPLVDAYDPKIHNACTSCHDANFDLVSLAAGKTFTAGGDCITCHGNNFPNHSHHNSSYNDVSYNATVDTSQTSQQGCAACHHEYDIVNNTSLGLNIWETILFEHDLDGTKDGSTNSCANCHAYEGGSSEPLVVVQNAIASGNPATCLTCHTDKVPDVNHGIPTSGKHPVHFVMGGVSCSTCHNLGNYHYFKSGTDSDGNGLYDLAETDVCYSCHKDGSGNPATDFKDGWSDQGFELVCASCHELPPSTGAHIAHYNGTDDTLAYGDLRITEDFTYGQVSSINMIGCGNCHPMDSPFHGNGVWGDIELSNISAPADSLKALSPSGSYDLITGECSNVYCHSFNSWTTDDNVPLPWPEATGWDLNIDPLPRPLPDNIIITRSYRNVKWNSGESLSCSGCHENPPQTSYADNDGGAGDSHYWIDPYGYENLHVYNMGNYPPIGCRTCHYETVNAWDETMGEAGGWNIDPTTSRRFYNDVALYNKAKHVNGSVDVAFDTDNNFTYTSTGSGSEVTYNLSISSFDSTTKTCSNVGCHIQETEVIWGLPYRWDNNTECNRCHGFR